MILPTPGEDARISTSCCFLCPGSACSAGMRRAVRASSRPWASLSCRLTKRMRTTSAATWALARFGRPGSDDNGRPAQHVEHMGGVEATDAIALEKLGNRRRADPHGFVGRWDDLAQIEQPRCTEVVFELEDRWKIAPQLFSQAVG